MIDYLIFCKINRSPQWAELFCKETVLTVRSKLLFDGLDLAPDLIRVRSFVVGQRPENIFQAAAFALQRYDAVILL
jgi:hypothetical protein